MLQRASSNAYSWWWASHIRAKQTRWLDDNIHDMESKVKSVLNLIEEDADSFAKKAEMYYRRRPELVSFIQDLYNSHRAMAERYERVSGELQKANTTIATIFPNQPHYESSDEDANNKDNETANVVDFSALKKAMRRTNQFFPYKDAAADEEEEEDRNPPRRIGPPMSREKVREEMHRLQTRALVLQTEREFIKGSYLNGLAKYMSTEKALTETQDEIRRLEDHTGDDGDEIAVVVEDDDSRVVMAVAALRSCKATLVGLIERQTELDEEAAVEGRRSRDTFRQLREEIHEDGGGGEVPVEFETPNLETLLDEIGEGGDFRVSVGTNILGVSDEIDELVADVIGLETTASSLVALVHGLRMKIDELENDFQSVVSVSDEAETDKVRYVELEMQRVKDMDRCGRNERNKFRSQLAEACRVFNALAGRLRSPEVVLPSEVLVVGTSPESLEESEVDVDELGFGQVVVEEEEEEECYSESRLEKEEESEDVAEPNWEQLYKEGLDGRQNMLLSEYTSSLRNLKDAKKKLAEEERKNKDLKNVIEMKDEQIRTLKIELQFFQDSWNEEEEEDPVPESDVLEEKKEDVNGDLLLLLPVSEHQSPSQSPPPTMLMAENLNPEDGLEQEQQPPGDENQSVDRPQALTTVEEEFRKEIDRLLEENLEFWLRFTSSFDQIQRFQSIIEDLHAEIVELKNAKKPSSKTDTSSIHIHKQLKDLQIDMSIWIDKNGSLKGELQSRFSSLCKIKEEITKAMEEETNEDGQLVQFSAYQAAKFQGEVLSMMQENNTVADELGSGLDHVKGLEEEASRALAMLEDNVDEKSTAAAAGNGNSKHNGKNKVPLRSFLFGAKPLKFTCMRPPRAFSGIGVGVRP